MIKKVIILLIPFMLGLVIHGNNKGIHVRVCMDVYAGPLDEGGDDGGTNPGDPGGTDEDGGIKWSDDPPYDGEPGRNIDIPEYCAYGVCILTSLGQCSCCPICKGQCNCPNRSCHQYPCICCPVCKQAYCTCSTP